MTAMLTEAEFERASGPLSSRSDFTDALRVALAAERGFACGKLGGSERAWLSHPPRIETMEGLSRRALELSLANLSLRHSGIWPTDLDSLLAFCEVFRGAVCELDAIGLFGDAFASELAIVEEVRPPGMLMRCQDQEPIRQRGALAEGCWLELLRGRRVLVVCPFADFLRDRARADVYEAAWSSAGKRWFEPKSVSSIELPYGFDPATQARYGSALELLDDVARRIDELHFDVALIGAGGLGIPLAAHVKGTGRVGLSLGGHLQVMFGVSGERWQGKPEWRDGIINDAWARLPERYRPDPSWTAEDYW